VCLCRLSSPRPDEKEKKKKKKKILFLRRKRERVNTQSEGENQCLRHFSVRRRLFCPNLPTADGLGSAGFGLVLMQQQQQRASFENFFGMQQPWNTGARANETDKQKGALTLLTAWCVHTYIFHLFFRQPPLYFYFPFFHPFPPHPSPRL